jgi:NAD(P)H-hydrate epimerase
MKPVLTAQQMREVDRRTTDEFAIPSIDLMENAARSVHEVIVEKLGGSVKGKGCVVLCGKGNNGGDGVAIARMLRDGGADVDALLSGRIDETKGDARINFERFVNLETSSRETIEINSDHEAIEFWSECRKRKQTLDLIVDAVFGTGLDRPIEGFYMTFLDLAMDYAHDTKPRPLLVSVDLPSGINSDRAEPIGFNFIPDVTVTFSALKIANIMPPVKYEQGELYVSDIGSPGSLVDDVGSRTLVSEAEDVRQWLYSSRFREDSYKKTRGSVLIAAGSKKYPGAAVLAGNGAMRSGAGIVTIVTPESAYSAVSERILPEVMVRPGSETASGAISGSAIREIADLCAAADSILIGCGLTSDEDDTREFVREIVTGRRGPVIVDADGLNALSPFDLMGTPAAPLVLTPHEGEFARLRGADNKLAPNERIDVLRDFAVQNHVICVLKGERTLVASPDGRVVINPTGNSALGKAGNGDNLAGLIGGFVAQAVGANVAGPTGREFELTIVDAVVSAVYIAGLAGEIAAKKFGKRVMTASDVRECLSEAFQDAARAE